MAKTTKTYWRGGTVEKLGEWEGRAERVKGTWFVGGIRRAGTKTWKVPGEVPAGVREYLCGDKGADAAGWPLEVPEGGGEWSGRLVAAWLREMGHNARARAREAKSGQGCLADQSAVLRARHAGANEVVFSFRTVWKVFRPPVLPKGARGAIRTMADLCNHFGGNGPSGMERRVYKDTACGASISLLSGGQWVHSGSREMAALTEDSPLEGFTIQSIVEGIEATADGAPVYVPCLKSDVEAAVRWVEEEADRLWSETHGCEKCGEEGEGGYAAVDPECAACGGDGTSF